MAAAETLYEKVHGAPDLIVQGKHTCFAVHRRVVLKASSVLQDEYAKVVTSVTDDAATPVIKLEALDDLILRRMLEFLYVGDYVGDYVDALSEEAEHNINNEIEWLHLHANLHTTTGVRDLKDLAAAYFCDVLERTSHPQVYLEAAKLAYDPKDSGILLSHVLVVAVWNLPMLLSDKCFRHCLATDSSLQRFGFDLLYFSFRLSLLHGPNTAWDEHIHHSMMTERYNGLARPDTPTTSLLAEKMQLEHAHEAAEKEIDRLRRENTSLRDKVDSPRQDITQPKRVDREAQAPYDSLISALEDLRHGDTWIIETLMTRLLVLQDTSASLLDVVRTWREAGELALANNKTLIRELAKLSSKVISMSRESDKPLFQSSDVQFSLMLQIARLKQDNGAAQDTIEELRLSADTSKHVESSLTALKNGTGPAGTTSELGQTSPPLVEDSEEQRVDVMELEQRLKSHYEANARLTEEMKRLPGHDLPPNKVFEKLQAEPVESKDRFTSAERIVEENEQHPDSTSHPTLDPEQHEAGLLGSQRCSDLESRNKALQTEVHQLRDIQSSFDKEVNERKSMAKELDQITSSNEIARLTEEVKRLRDTNDRLEIAANERNDSVEMKRGIDSKELARLTQESDQHRASILRLEIELDEQKALGREAKERLLSQNNDGLRVKAERDQLRTSNSQLRLELAKQKAAVVGLERPRGSQSRGEDVAVLILERDQLQAEITRLGGTLEVQTARNTDLEHISKHCKGAAAADRATIAGLERELKARDTKATELTRSTTWYTEELARLTKEVDRVTQSRNQFRTNNKELTQSRNQLRINNKELKEEIADLEEELDEDEDDSDDDDADEAEAIRYYVLQLITHPQKCMSCYREFSMYDLERDDGQGTLGIWLRCKRCGLARCPRPKC